MEIDGDSKSKTELNCYLDDIMRELLTRNDPKYFDEIITTLISKNVNLILVINHSFFVFIRNQFIENLEESNGNIELSYRISQLFCQQMTYINDKSLLSIEQFFVERNFIEYLIKSLKNISMESSNHLIRCIANMINFARRFQEDHQDIQNNSILSGLILSIVDFVKSKEYEQIFYQLSIEQNELTSFQDLILIVCPKYINSYRAQLQEEVVSIMAQEMLSCSLRILEYFLSFIDKWNKSIISCISQLILLCQRCANEHFLRAYDMLHGKILDQIVKIIQRKSLWSLMNKELTSKQHDEGEEKHTNDLLCYSALYIYTMTFLPELREKLKEYQITPILLELTQMKDEKTQFHAYRALAAVLTDNDIKQLANPTQITNVFLLYMNKFIDNILQRQRLENLLLSLKSID